MSADSCDLHLLNQVIARVDTQTGEMVTRRLEHKNGEARRFYRSLPQGSLIGIEATGYTQWFERSCARTALKKGNYIVNSLEVED